MGKSNLAIDTGNSLVATGGPELPGGPISTMSESLEKTGTKGYGQPRSCAGVSRSPPELTLPIQLPLTQEESIDMLIGSYMST
jgi:hypothetical protein